MNYTEPHVAVPEDVIPKMLELASVAPAETVFDLGSGDGRMVVAAARDLGAKAVGVEIRRRLVMESRRRARETGVSDRVSIWRRNFKEVNLRKADVLALYLSSYTLNLLAPKFLRELKPGARIVNFDYEIPGWTPTRVLRVTPKGWKKAHPIYLYVVRAEPR